MESYNDHGFAINRTKDGKWLVSIFQGDQRITLTIDDISHLFDRIKTLIDKAENK